MGRGTGDKQGQVWPGTMGQGSFRAVVGCLCSSQELVAEAPTPPSPLPFPAPPGLDLPHGYLPTSSPSSIRGPGILEAHGISPPPSRTLIDKGKAAAPKGCGLFLGLQALNLIPSVVHGNFKVLNKQFE